MIRKARCLVLVLTFFLSINQVIANTPVEVTDVKEIGLSDSDETKSVIEIKWKVNPTLQPNHSEFNVTLEVIYADGAVLIFDEQAESEARSAKIEVPALHIYRGKKPAIIKEIKAFVTTNWSASSLLAVRSARSTRRTLDFDSSKKASLKTTFVLALLERASKLLALQSRIRK